MRFIRKRNLTLFIELTCFKTQNPIAEKLEYVAQPTRV